MSLAASTMQWTAPKLKQQWARKDRVPTLVPADKALELGRWHLTKY